MLCHWASGSQHYETLSSSCTPRLLKMKAPQSFRMSGTTHPLQHHIPEDLKLQMHCSESLTSHNSTLSLYILLLDTHNPMDQLQLQQQRSMVQFSWSTVNALIYIIMRHISCSHTLAQVDFQSGLPDP